MIILGISAFYHDSAACILRDGKVLAAAQEERFTRRKHDSSFPRNAIAFCLEECGIQADELDCVAFYEKPILKFDRALESFLHSAPRNLLMFSRGMGSWFSEKLRVPDLLKKELGYKGKVVFASHHESHAASAFYLSPYESAAVLTVDGVGEWATTCLSKGEGNALSLLSEMTFPHSLGLLYSAFTHYLGFRVNWGEYKVMGLAPYGSPTYVDTILSKLVDVRDDGSFRLYLERFAFLDSEEMTDSRFAEVFGEPKREAESELTSFHMDVAHSLQVVTTQILLAQARFAREQTGERNLCLAGGVALNCVANGEIARAGLFDSIWIQPAANDSGGALGAALVAWHKAEGRPREVDPNRDGMQGAYLGPKYTEPEILEALHHAGLEGEVLSDDLLLDRAADLLSSGSVLGWFQGRMEFGPRALGHRSILADPRGEDVQRRVNEKIKFREGFRPFAPAVLAEKCKDWFSLDHESPYMLLVAPVSPQVRVETSDESVKGLDRLHVARSKIQAVTHVDFSARVQTVREESDLRFYGLIKAFEQRTGTPVLLNTSFNLRGEPICEHPSHAISSFLASGMDALVLENVLVMRPKDALPTGVVAAVKPPQIAAPAPSWVQRGMAIGIGAALVAISWWGGFDGVGGKVAPVLGGILSSTALLWPTGFGWIHRGIERWVRVALNGVSTVCFAIVFLGLVTPIGFVKRRVSSGELDVRPDPHVSSYWKPAEWSSHYERMF